MTYAAWTHRFNRDVVVKPRRLPLGLFQWVFPIFNYPEDDIMRVAGLDTVVFSRILYFGEYSCAVLVCFLLQVMHVQMLGAGSATPICPCACVLHDHSGAYHHQHGCL